METKYINEKNIKIDIEKNIENRPRLKNLHHFNESVKSKLFQMLYKNGPGNGCFLSLPFDQKYVEHGPLHDFLWEKSAQIKSIAQLVNKGNFSAYVLPAEIAVKYKHLFRPDIPLIYKIDGHFTQPKSANTPSKIGSIKQALQIGATAIGITFYLGGKEVNYDMERVNKIVDTAHDSGLPVVIWSYPRGPGISEPLNEKDEGVSQADSLYWVHYAVAAAEALGADVIKTKFPQQVKPQNRKIYEKMLDKLSKKNYSAVAYKYLEPENPDIELTEEQHIYRVSLVTRSSPSSFVIFSGGPKIKGDAKESLVKQTRIVMKGGAEGGIYGRNIWGVPVEEGIEIANNVIEEIQKKEFHRSYE
ncbi:MAG: hypothetical protein B6U87_02885 [Candidatus Aenigmarchaeota archaeon ex4484_52]|nr:MAG: hypothetical protein B6U87_02885 [Candidatus Aenigmarchaeota archaeon ex4484_52]